MTTPFYQSLDPDPVPSPITPMTGDPTRPAAIPANERGTAPYDISGPQDIAGITAACSAAGALVGAGIVYPVGERQTEARDNILVTPQGAPSANVFAGFPDYENQDLRPPGEVNGPIQGEGAGYPGTTQDGITQFTAGLGAGVEGVPPERGDMGPGSGVYPGTVQGDLRTYGTG